MLKKTPILCHGFLNLPSYGKDRPQWAECGKVLTNENFKPSKLPSHLQNCHPNLQNKVQAYFQRRTIPLNNIQFCSSRNEAQKF